MNKSYEVSDMTKQEKELYGAVTELLAKHAKLEGENEQLKGRIKFLEEMVRTLSAKPAPLVTNPWNPAQPYQPYVTPNPYTEPYTAPNPEPYTVWCSSQPNTGEMK